MLKKRVSFTGLEGEKQTRTYWQNQVKKTCFVRRVLFELLLPGTHLVSKARQLDHFKWRLLQISNLPGVTCSRPCQGMLSHVSTTRPWSQLGSFRTQFIDSGMVRLGANPENWIRHLQWWYVVHLCTTLHLTVSGSNPDSVQAKQKRRRKIGEPWQ